MTRMLWKLEKFLNSIAAPFVGGLMLLLAIVGLALTRCAPAAPIEFEDYGRTCLALVMFGEARSDGEAGMREVGRVVLRRVLDPQERFGGDICTVATDREQFLVFASWRTPRHPERMDAREWAQARKIAGELIAAGPDRADEGPCPGALYFNQTAGAAICKIGVHYFR